MLRDWIEVTKTTKKFKSFTLINVDEKKIPNKKILDYLGEEMLNSYRRVEYLKRTYSKKTPKTLKKYLTNIVFPPVVDPFNVQQGDFGETIARLFIEKFQSLKVPCYKLRYKFNNSKAVFCTDIFAHNTGAKITDLKYYEVKTKINNSKSEVSIKGIKQQRHIGVVAHEGLAKDENKINNEYIADFIRRLYEIEAGALEEAGLIKEADEKYKIAGQYGDIVDHPKKYNRSFELVLIIEKDQFSDEVLKDLASLPPSLDPLDVTIILIKDIKKLVDSCVDKAIDVAIKKVYAK